MLKAEDLVLVLHRKISNGRCLPVYVLWDEVAGIEGTNEELCDVILKGGGRVSVRAHAKTVFDLWSAYLNAHPRAGYSFTAP